MRWAGLTLSAIAVVLIAADVVVGDLAAIVVGAAGMVGMMFVAVRRLAGARRDHPSWLDHCSPADQKRVRTACSHPERIAGLSPQLREVTRAAAEQQVYTAAAALPWWFSCIAIFAGATVWRAIEAPSLGSLMNVLTAVSLGLLPAAYLHQARKGRGVLARFQTDPALREP